MMALLARCRDFALPFYTDLFNSTRKGLCDRLFEQAERGGNGQDQRVYFDAVPLLATAWPAMQQAFEAALQESLRAFEAGHDDPPPPPPPRLALVGKEQLEDELAVSTIVSRANSQHAETLWALNRRLAVLRGGRQVADDTNPFGPARVGRALQAAMAQLDCDLKARLFIYKHLGKLLLAAFGRVFGALNTLLAEAGILSHLRFELKKGADEKGTAEEGVAPHPAVLHEASAELIQRQLYQAVSHELGRLLAAKPGPRTSTLSGSSYHGLQAGGAGAVFRALDYALVLSALQQTPEFASSAALDRPMPIQAAEERFFAQLKRQAGPTAERRLDERDADTIDVVGMIFRYLLDESSAPSCVKSLLSHLHPPYLKLALLDQRLLDDPRHPARQLLNAMADAGSRWVTDAEERVVWPRLREMVATILRDFVDEPALFDAMLADFRQFMAGVEKRAALVEKRGRDAQEGLERLSTARHAAAVAVRDRIIGAHLPAAIEQLLLQPWTDFLAFNYLRGGAEGLAWRAALKVVDGVLHSVDGSAELGSPDSERRRQQLEQALAEGLRTIGYDHEAGERLLGGLREAQVLAAAGRLEVANEAALAAPVAAAEPEPALTAAEQQLAEQLLTVPFGTWFEFDRPDGSTAALRLAWSSRVSSHYMFVNQAGIKQGVETLATLARGMAAGQVRLAVLDRRSFMERALDAVLRRLQGGAPARSQAKIAQSAQQASLEPAPRRTTATQLVKEPRR